MVKIKEKFKAFTLIEVILVVAGITLLHLISIKKLKLKKIAKQEANLILAAVSELRSQFPSGGAPFSHLSRLNIYPSNRIIRESSPHINTGIYMPWESGAMHSRMVEITGRPIAPSSTNRLLLIEITFMPKDVCINFIPKMYDIFGRIEVVPQNSLCGP